MTKRIYTLFVLFCFVLSSSVAQITIKDDDLKGGETYNWTKNNVYVLDGYVYLEDDGVLNIEAGTVIRGLNVPSNGVDQTSALIISRGGKIFANGTADEPIIMTAELDDLTTTTDFTANDNQFWGGLIVLGNAPIGEDVDPNSGETFPTDVIEGIPSTESRIRYGGTDANDSSGKIKYVSIRHGGSILGANNEINGLTLGGVGAGTEIDYVEVFANKDDGIEVFGGTVNIKHAIVAFCGDDSYDFDESWDGSMQYLLSLQLDRAIITGSDTSGVGDHAIEYDGSEANDKEPKTVGRIYNATFIGAGVSSANNEDSDGIRIREDAAAQIWNSVIVDVPGYAWRVGDTSVDRLKAGESAFASNITNDAGTYVRDADADVIAALTAGGSVETDPQLGGISREPNGGLDPRPNAGSPALSDAATDANKDDIIDNVTFRGAFNNSDNWALGWSAMDTYGYFGDLATPQSTCIIKDEDLVGGTTYDWTNDKEYILDGYVYLEDGGVLNIEAGTVIRGLNVPSNGVDQTSALIIARGGKIFANGTAAEPIIMTAELDDLSSTTDFTANDNQFWGGLIMLGNAPIGEDVDPNSGETFPTDVIEGIPSTESRIRYGGTDANDSSGKLNYVSIRHGGSILGANNEINGLTLGGVGAGTEIDYVEVFANKDDGIEVFGGTVNLKHTVVAFCGDDSYDFDESWDGSMQYLLSVQLDRAIITGSDTSGVGDHAIEYDGSEANDKQPKTVGRIYNATFIGAGVNSSNNQDSDGIRIREDAAAQIWNSIIVDVPGYAWRVGDTSIDRLKAGESAFASNITNDSGDYVRGNDADVIAALSAGNSVEANPDLAGISREPNGGLDPRPNSGSPALSDVAIDANKDAIIDDTDFRGAFSNSENWALRWTAMDQYGYFGDLVSVGTYELGENEAMKLTSLAPNPASDFTMINFELTEPVNQAYILVYDVTGKMIFNRALGSVAAGENQEQLNIGGLTNGQYFVMLQTEKGTVYQKLIVNNHR